MLQVKSIAEIESSDIWELFWRDYNKPQTIFSEASADLWRRLRNPVSMLEGIIVFDEGGPIGFVHYRLFETTQGVKPECYIQDLYVAPEYRGKGAGGFVLNWFKEQAQAKGWAKVTLKTRAENAGAQKLYDKLCARKENHIHYVVTDLGQ